MMKKSLCCALLLTASFSTFAAAKTEQQIAERFKEEVGETIHALIHAEKLEKARSLLISTTLAINEISQMCGYPSLQYFYSVFKKEYVTTPKEYRDQHSEALL
ncbi:helix-turn-helix transcriptional regulator [Salmonella enterica subsp. enterica serovar Dublin]|nr:helix-turn-helix transcriptional regulator [Salmonella enterica subsp. enterica serovar Dublin]EEP7103398.1 helix-turn-helix transcriptional regulator [Salmonella enterica subsp. enterica serovar Dublin]EEP7115621.1 helix-turn-helix transcriptional regulator [Salmonella enterica subsp. enterica serovar Dublin]EEP7121309.1 helix-turn-helix transcriptional regulator [Salmonella enterica subsp. enterica serovar Dublin]EEW9724387.1 helix-turn-helix transcriptional regulator [Salmonella enterica 